MSDLPVDVRIDEKAKEIVKAMEALDEIIMEQFRIRRDLLNITEQVRQGRFNIARMKEEKESLTRLFWRNKQ